MRRAVVWLAYAGLAGFVWAGFLGWRSENPAFLGWSAEYLALLALGGALLLIPAALALAAGRYGPRRVAFASVSCLSGLALAYVVAAGHYYATRRYPFDPFLQAAPPELGETALRGGFRVLALGGSTTRNDTLAPAERYPAVLERELRDARADLDVAVFNAGMDWYTTKHSLIDYVTRLREWRPDVVVVLHAMNDLVRSCTSRFSTTAAGKYERDWSHFYGPALNAANPPVFARSLYQRFLHEVDRKWYAEWRFRERDVPVDSWASLPEFRSHLRNLVHYVRADGARVVLVTQPALLRDDLSALERRALSFSAGFCEVSIGWGRHERPSLASFRAALDAFNDTVRQVGREFAVPVADAAAAVPKNLQHFVDDVHFTPTAARQVADLVAVEVLALAPAR